MIVLLIFRALRHFLIEFKVAPAQRVVVEEGEFVGCVVIQVGNGMSSLDDVKEVLAGKDATFGLAKPCGLTLLDVTYPDLEFWRPETCPYTKRIDRDLYVDAMRLDFHRSLNYPEMRR